ncbi:hypothetical protein AVEN_230558-1 [Araneus ventricosus]|uniref:Uncharacterized protein n=1 Tax=Araneus ventricosus TaxID=182803 RepID=A0A4Y2RM16_ARAVE|nr:hypothetical protein AVEN_230558-1 [Araneus ventricosus]
MNYLTDKVCTTSPRKHFRANRFGNHSRKNLRRKAFYEPPVPSCAAPSGVVVIAFAFQLYDASSRNVKFCHNLQRNRTNNNKQAYRSEEINHSCPCSCPASPARVMDSIGASATVE